MLDVYAVSNQGGRHSMEDVFCLIPNFNNQRNWIFGGVYDGHGGIKVAELAAKKIPNLFLKLLKNKKSIKEAFEIAYQKVSDMGHFNYVGCTALSFFIKNKKMFIANTGDSRMIIANRGDAEQISSDHDVRNINEKKRIIESGGEIEGKYVYKGNNGLMPTRTLGDHYFKNVGIIAKPEITIRVIPDSKNVFFILATDGLWNKMTNEQVGEVIRRTRTAKRAANKLLNFLTTEKNAIIGSYLDNISIIVMKT